MGILEDGFSRLHWPPLVRTVTQTTEYPGYRYEFFRSFGELDSYFSELLGTSWRSEEWARYWMNQHAESKREDRKLANPRQRKSTGPRRDAPLLYALSVEHLNNYANISSRKLVKHLKDSHDIQITPMTAWRIIGKWKNAG